MYIANKLFRILIFLLWGTSSVLAIENPFVFDVLDSGVSANTTGRGGHIQQTDEGVKLIYRHDLQWPSILFPQDQIGYLENWSDYSLLGITLTNPSDVPVGAGIHLSSKSNPAGGRSAVLILPARETHRLLFPLVYKEKIVGMSGQPPMRERVNIDYDWAFRAGGPSRWYSGTGELK